MYFKYNLILGILTFGNSLFSQLPVSSMYLLEIKNPSDSNWVITKINYLSALNPTGYNNQPFFIDNNHLLACIRKPENSNTEIYKFDLLNKTATNITNSASSEYSPRVYPENSEEISCVKVPENDSTIQNLVILNASNGKQVKFITKDHSKIGYYRYLKNKTWVCYLVQEPHVLSIYSELDRTRKIFASSIGRCFEVVNLNEIYFVHKITEDHWVLKSYNIDTEKSKTIAKMPPGVEDFVINSNQQLICASKSSILRLTESGTWSILTDLKALNINNIGRLAIFGNRLVLVNMNAS